MLAFQLFVKGDNLGALNVYSRQAKAFDCESKHTGLLLAAHAAVAFADAQKTAQWRNAAQSRDLIGQAMGILMERYKVTAHQAFLLLVKTSSTGNIKLIDVANYLASTGALPTDGDLPLAP